MMGFTLAGLSGSQQGIRSKTAIELAVLSGAMLTARLELPLAFPDQLRDTQLDIATADPFQLDIATIVSSIIIHVYLNVSLSSSQFIIMCYHPIAPKWLGQGFLPHAKLSAAGCGSMQPEQLYQALGSHIFRRVPSFSASGPKTKLHALHQLGAFVHELLLGNGCLLIDLQIHGSDGPGGCGNGELCAVRNTP